MKLTNKQLNELISNIAGDDVPPLISILKGKSNVSEFKLADELNITVNQIRNMLYRLHNYNLVHFNRKKDKKKGWYIYYWTLNLKNTKHLLQNFKKQQLQDFIVRLDREKKSTFYVCPNKCIRYNDENAMENDFRCEECGELVRVQDNSRTIENINSRIEDLKKEVENVAKFEEKKFVDFGKKKKVTKKKPVKKATKKKTVKKVTKKKPVKKTAKKKTVKKVTKKKPVKKTAKKKTVKKVTKKKPVKKKVSILKKVSSKLKKQK